MRIYSDFPARRSRQILGDVLAVVGIALWVWFGVTVHATVDALASFGVQMEQAGGDFQGAMDDVGESLGGVPLIGSGIRAPFDGAASAGQSLAEAGRAQQEAVHQLALTLGIGIAALPILTILVLWLVPRIRFVRRAARVRAVAQAEAGVELLALRALATQKLPALQAVDADPLGAWRRGDAVVVRRLAGLELRSAGVRLPE